QRRRDRAANLHRRQAYRRQRRHRRAQPAGQARPASGPVTVMRAALFQMTSGIDPAANAAAIADMAARARAEGADMLFTPEMAGYLDRDRRRAAETLRAEAGDPVLAAIREAAAKHGLWVHIGSLAFKDERADGR